MGRFQTVVMISKSLSYVRLMDCCGCFGSTRKPKRILRPYPIMNKNLSQELLFDIADADDDDDDECFSVSNEICSYNGETTNTVHGGDDEMRSSAKHSEDVVKLRIQNGLLCRDISVREIHKVVRDEVTRNSLLLIKFCCNYDYFINLANMTVSPNFCVYSLVNTILRLCPP